MQKYESIMDNSNMLLSKNVNWAYPILRFAMLYIAYTGRFDTVPQFSSKNKIFVGLENCLRWHNITNEELVNKCDEEIRKMFTVEWRFMSERNVSYSSPSMQMNIGNLMFIGETKVCFKLPINEIEFATQSEYVEIFVERSPINYDNSSVNNEYENTVTLDFIGRPFTVDRLYQQFDSVIAFQFGENVSSALKMNNFYQAVPIRNGIQQCSEDKSWDECQLECRIKATQKICNCTPINYPTYTSAIYNSCSFHDYEHCQLNFSKDACDCLRLCSEIEYEETRWNYESIDHNKAQLTLRLSSLSYTFLEEQFIWSLSTFFAALGGNLGFWIGIEFLMLTQGFCFVITLFVRFSPFKKFMKNKTEPVQNNAANAAMELEDIE